MIGSIIVFGSILFAAGFVVAWLVRPEVRAWLETPKHRFQANVRRYDQSAARSVRLSWVPKREGGSRTMNRDGHI